MERPSAPASGRRRWLAVPLIAAFVLAAAGSGYWYWQENRVATPPEGHLAVAQREEVFDAFWQAAQKQFPYFEEKQIDWEQVRKTYRKQIRQAPDDPAFHDALLRAVAELKDTHVALLSPKLVRANVNLLLNMDGERVVIRQVVPDSDAAKAGLKAGMEITSVDGKPVAEVWQAEYLRTSDSTEYGRKWRSARLILTGPPNSAVKVGVKGADGESREVELTRNGRGIPIEPAEWRYLDGNVLYLKIATFNDGRATFRVADAMKEAATKQVAGLIIDLRGNGGGVASDGFNLVDWLFDTPQKIAYNWTATTDLGDPATSKPRDVTYKGPVYLLTDPGCVSACDITAAVLTRLGRAKVVGEPPAGASMIAADIRLPHGFVIHLSGGSDILGPDKKLIEGNPAKVDYPVAPTAADWAAGRDPVLEKALSLVR